MHDFILREIKDADISQEIEKIGFDKSYIHKACEKFDYKNIKIYSLTPAQANIIKQTAISAGADCATHREVITGKADLSNCILGGSVSQIKKIAEKLKFQPFGLKELGEKLIKAAKQLGSEAAKFETNPLTIQPFNPSTKNDIDLFAYPSKIVGILNLTPDSFSDGGMFNDFESAKNHLDEMIKDGADIIDIGAESTKPYSSPVSDEEQLKKLLPIIEFARGKCKISVDTRSAKVAQECLKAGASIINDVSGLCYDEKMIDVISEYNCPVVIQHSKGTPENMQENPQYDDVIEEIYLDLYKKCKLAKSKGIENIIIDPGIGFGKTRENNFEIIRRVEEFKGLGYPLMLGISRKSFLQSDNNEERDILTTALNALAIERKVDFLRVHNVKMHKALVDLMKYFV
jgi:dihydropteroate synthase